VTQSGSTAINTPAAGGLLSCRSGRASPSGLAAVSLAQGQRTRLLRTRGPSGWCRLAGVPRP
jgi:hypothetical protein